MALRRDAARNRTALVEAAARAFGEQGLGASVNAIAEDAGVNVATLYRHFPTKDDLIVAVVEGLMDPLVAARDAALASGTDVLGTFLRAAATIKQGQRGLADALGRHPMSEELRARMRAPAVATAEPLVARAHADGSLAAQYDVIDVLVALRMLSTVAEQPERAERFADVLLRGLRP